MQTPLKTSTCYVHKTPSQTPTMVFNVPSYLKNQYGQRLTNLDDKVTYLEKLLGLMRLPKPQYTTYLPKQINPEIHTLSEKHEKTVKAIQKAPEIREILDSQQLLINLLKLLGIEPQEFQNNYWTIDEGFIIALRDQLNIDRWLEGWKEKMRPLLKSNDFEDFFKELEDLLFVCVMTIDYLRRFKDKNGEDLVKKGLKVPEKQEKLLQVDTIPDYEGIIKKLKEQLRESEEEKALLTKIFAEKTEGLNTEIKKMERNLKGIEEKRNEALEVIKEGVLERSLLHEEIESLKQRTEDEKEEENEENRKKQRRKKYALIDDLHARLKVADRVNKLLAERMEDLIINNEKLKEDRGIHR